MCVWGGGRCAHTFIFYVHISIVFALQYIKSFACKLQLNYYSKLVDSQKYKIIFQSSENSASALEIPLWAKKMEA